MAPFNFQNTISLIRKHGAKSQNICSKYENIFIPKTYFFGLIGRTTFYTPSQERMMIRLPPDGKQTATAERNQSTVCMEHGVNGHEVVRWWAVMALVGRPFLRRANGGQLDTLWGPLGMDGKAVSQGVFGTILEGIGSSFFGLENVDDVNAFRTARRTRWPSSTS